MQEEYSQILLWIQRLGVMRAFTLFCLHIFLFWMIEFQLSTAFTRRQFMDSVRGNPGPFPYHTPIPHGPYVVGCIDVMIGRTRKGTLMRVYYPSRLSDLQSHSQHWTPWYLGKEYTHGLSTFIAPSIPTIFDIYFDLQMRNIATPAVWGAPVAARKFMVIIFSHGLSANRSIYSTICSELASQGFIVAAIEHRDMSASASFILTPSGEKEFIAYESAGKIKEYSYRNQQLKIRVAESMLALDALEKINDGTAINELASDFNLHQLRGRLDLSHPVMAGHSFGGVTAIATLASDQRFKVGVALDPWMFPVKDELHEISVKLRQPLLCISTEKFQTPANLEAMAKLNPATTTYLTIKGTVHQNQCDTPFVVGHIGRILIGATSSLDPHIAMDINNRLMLNFISNHIGEQGETVNKYIPYLETHKDKLVPGLYGRGKTMYGWDPERKSFWLPGLVKNPESGIRH
ncbi:platelet-activating factor acetylhydrolase [Procambarus clarkii]|uniref:platelet-activating factor acetylhydrolase n=1 Tax=Procambarus clarkii TaxID=6728 RepID=UPI003742EC6F